ncbi:MAG: hypothetical protein IKB73_01260 [Ruminococcus sp.]|nr:hypothetical protein [Ruminococcus sp.]
MKNVLFICTGNTCRSPMAQALFNKICEEKGLDMHASSAGVATVDGLTAAKHAIDTMAMQGIDLSTHKSRFLPNVKLSNYDLFVTMNYDQSTLVESLGVPRDRIVVLSKTPADKYDIEVGIADPFGSDMAAYRKCAEDLRVAINELIETL